MPERADAARNRRAILRAAEDLFARNGPEHVSMEQVAAAAGVGKGTVFHRFTSREGLVRALVEDRVQVLQESLTAAPPPLGPGAPPRERLIAFLDATIELATKNIALIAAFDQSTSDRQASPTYQIWHTHVRTLIAEARPELDAELLAHILLSSLHSDLIVHLLRNGQSERLTKSLHDLVGSLLS
jgi:AcrR family transcriptional regulator